MKKFSSQSQRWRWWNGTVWSLNVHSHRAARTAARRAKQPSKNSSRVRWTDAYPANARVPRVAPTK